MKVNNGNSSDMTSSTGHGLLMCSDRKMVSHLYSLTLDSGAIKALLNVVASHQITFSWMILLRVITNAFGGSLPIS